MNPSNLSLRQKSRGTVVKTIAIHVYGARDPNYIVDLTLSNLLWSLPIPTPTARHPRIIVGGRCFVDDHVAFRHLLVSHCFVLAQAATYPEVFTCRPSSHLWNRDWAVSPRHSLASTTDALLNSDLARTWDRNSRPSHSSPSLRLNARRADYGTSLLVPLSKPSLRIAD